MSRPKARATVVVPNWNGAAVLGDCLRSLEAQTFEDFHVVLVDNGSTDGSPSLLRQTPLDFSLVRFPCNQGFAAAVNAGIARTESQCVLLLNNDATLHPRCLERAVSFLDRHPRTGAVACRVMQYPATDRLDSLGMGLSREFKAFQLGWNRPWKDVMVAHPFRVFGPCGSCALFRRSAFRTVGLFRESFFAYMEDVDWALRAALRGVETCALPEAVAFHRGSHTTGGHYNPFSLYHIVRNQLLVLRSLPARVLAASFFPVLKGQLKTAGRALAMERQAGVACKAWLDFVKMAKSDESDESGNRRAWKKLRGWQRLSEKQRRWLGG